MSLPRVESYVVTVAHRRSFWRPFLRFVRANPYRLRESQLESALRAVALQDLMRLLVLCVPNSCYVAAYRAVTRSTCLLIINTEIGVVGQKIDLVTERLDDGARKVLRSWQSNVVERLVCHCKRTILVRE